MTGFFGAQRREWVELRPSTIELLAFRLGRRRTAHWRHSV